MNTNMPLEVELERCREARKKLITKVERLQRKLIFYETPGAIEEDGWCAEHEKRFQSNSTEDGDECQICRADKAEAEREKLIGALELFIGFMPDKFPVPVGYQQVEAQARAVLAEVKEKEGTRKETRR